MSTRFNVCVEILADAMVPRKRSQLATAMPNVDLGSYLSELTKRGYLAASGPDSNLVYARTERAKRAMTVYGAVAHIVDGLYDSDLIVLRNLVNDGCSSSTKADTRRKVLKRLGKRGLVDGERPTKEGTAVIEQAKDLFDLVDCALSVR